MAGTKRGVKRQAAAPAPKPAAPKTRAEQLATKAGGTKAATKKAATTKATKTTSTKPVLPAKVAPLAKSASRNGNGHAPTASRTQPKTPPRTKATVVPVANAPAKKTAPTKRAAKPAARGGRTATNGARRKPAKAGKPSKPAPPIVRLVKVRQLDPLVKCGPSTSVEQLFRVDEEANGHMTVHLVFLDRHGWYCVHGPRCVAVADVHSHTRTPHGARAGGR